jgi:polysaccharide biosynthesis transport protein
MSERWRVSEELAGSEEPQVETHFLEYWEVLLQRKRLIFLCIAAALALAALISVFSKPTYQAVAVIALEKSGGHPLDSTAPDAGQDRYDPEFLPTQIELLKSREIAERVVKKLRLVDNPLYRSNQSGFFQFVAKKGPEPPAEARIIDLAEGIQRGLDAQAVKDTDIIKLTAIAPTPKLASEIANAAAESYMDWNVESGSQVAEQASSFLGTEIEQLRKDVADKERQLLAYGRQKDIVASDPQANASLQNLESLNRDYASVVADRIAKEARYYEMRNARSDSIADVASNGLISQLRGEQARLERDYAEKLNLFKPDWPAMLQLKAQIDKGRQHLEAEIEDSASKARASAKTDYETSLRREANMKTALGAQKSQTMVTSGNAVEYNNLRVELEAKKTLLDAMLKRLSETQMVLHRGGQHVSNIRIVDHALPPDQRYSPSYRKNALLGLASGVLVGLGLAFFLSYMDRSLRTSQDIERYIQLPPLGIIPAAQESSGKTYSLLHRRHSHKKREGEEPASIELLPHVSQRSRIAESYRAFQMALFRSRAGGVKSVVITSTFAGEGKTATSVNLAIVLGQLGKRVLLVDADLHRPHLHEVLGVSNRIGLVSILADSVDPASAVAKTDLPGVFVIPSGPPAPNPSVLLASEAMSSFLESVGVTFDFIILDVPPVMAVADALILGALTDGVVLCVHGGLTPRERVVRARNRLIRANVRILGVLLNNLREQPDRYRQRYGYEDYQGPSGYGEEQAAASAASARLT